MILSYYRKKGGSEILHFGADFCDATLVKDKTVFSLFRQEGLEQLEGTIQIRGKDLLQDEVSYVSFVYPDLPKGVETKDYAFNAALDKYVSEIGIKFDEAFRFRLLMHNIYIALESNPDYVLVDLSKAKEAQQSYICNFLAKVFQKAQLLIHAPFIFGDKAGDFLPISSAVYMPSAPLKPSIDMEHIAFDAFVNDIAGIASPRPGNLAEQYMAGGTLDNEAPALFEGKPKPATEPSQGEPKSEEPKRRNPFSKIDEKTKSFLINILFTVLFLILSVSVCPISMAFGKGEYDLMYFVCVTVCVVFSIMLAIPVVSIYKEGKEPFPWSNPAFLITYVSSSLVSFVAGIVMVFVVKSRDVSTTMIPFFLAYFLSPIIVGSYAAFTYLKRKKENN